MEILNQRRAARHPRASRARRGLLGGGSPHAGARSPVRRPAPSITPQTTGETRNEYIGAYAPNRKWIALRIEGNGRHRLALVPPDGHGLHEIAVSGDPQADIDWRPVG